MLLFSLGWTFCAAAVGVAIGYVVGGQTLSLFVDIDKVDASRYVAVDLLYFGYVFKNRGTSLDDHSNI